MSGENKIKALDVFMYLGIAISLVTIVTNCIEVLFTAIDMRFVDILSASSYSYDNTQSDVRFAVASLVVMFPIYVFLSWYTGRDIAKFLYKQDLMVRKVMIYATLFISVLTLIGTLVAVIYHYLGGELTVRFGYKALSVFVIALALFSYYYYSLRRDYSKRSYSPYVITLFATILVGASLAWSVSVVGSPSEMRAKKIDGVRLSDISRIQQEVLNRINTSDKLPGALSELDNAFQGYQVPVDPVTKESYGYKVLEQPIVKFNYTTSKKEMTSKGVFEVCATFDTKREVDARGMTMPSGVGGMDAFYSASNYYYEGDQSPFWNHDAGLVCFKRVITPDLYYGR